MSEKDNLLEIDIYLPIILCRLQVAYPFQDKRYTTLKNLDVILF